MGAASGVNRFWELFWRGDSEARFRLVTPPAVADNGGLALAASGTALTVGFVPSQLLRFTPLALTVDRGATWTPGVFPGALASGPDALATSPSGATAALVGSGGGTIFERSATGARWEMLASAATLATAAKPRCDAPRMTAVAFSSTGTLLAAGSCKGSGSLALFADGGRGWRRLSSLDPARSARLATVLLLSRVGTTTFALIDLTGAANAVVAAWSSDAGGRWRLSRPLALAVGTRLLAAGVGYGDAVYVLSGGQRRSVELASPTTGSWRALPAPPAGTAALATGPAGEDALAATGSTLTDWRLAPGARRWRRTGSLHVPIQYGSSS